jgi:hypothetical protein
VSWAQSAGVPTPWHCLPAPTRTLELLACGKLRRECRAGKVTRGVEVAAEPLTGAQWCHRRRTSFP